MGERLVRNEEVRGSIPLSSTNRTSAADFPDILITVTPYALVDGVW